MQPVSKILLPVDFSERSTAAAQFARTLGSRFDAEILVLHVVAPAQFDLGASEISGSQWAEIYRNVTERASAELESFLKAELAGYRARQVTLEGEPAAKIVEMAHAEKAGVIVMPTHGFGTFRRFILGSNTAKVLHDADCPVFTGVHLENAPTVSGNFSHILCGVDLGPQSSKTLCWAAMLASAFGARLTVIHATACASDASAKETGPHPDVRKSAEEELVRLRRFVNAEFEPLVEAGEPAAVLCSAAARLGAEVMVIGRGSAAGVFGRLRTNAYAIIRQSPCPVVSV